MTKKIIDFKVLRDPLTTFNSLFGLNATSLDEFFEYLRDTNSLTIIELKNTNKLDDNLNQIIELFENVQQKNPYVYVIRGIK